MEEKEKIIKNIKYLIEKSGYFTELKKNESFLFEELKKIKKSDLNELMKYYKGGEKVKKIRYLAAKSLLENELTQEKLETIKIEVNSEHKKNILHAWKNFGILYVLFFNPIKEKVKKYLKEISSFISSNLELEFKIKNIDFDGSQNQGRCSCWIAFYNPKYKSQSEGYQYALDLNIKDLHYGIYHYKTNKEIFEETFNKEEINEKLLEKIIKNLKEYSYIVLEEEKEVVVNKNKIPLNQILYGPPGTGKTYNTINKALEIIDNEFYLKNQNDREILKDKFEEYKENGQIEFITFHQSYGYEEFVEGIKANTNEKDDIIYQVEDGVFKRLSKEAKRNYIKTTKAKNIKQDFEVIFKEEILDKLTEDSLKINTPRGFFEITEINKTTIRFDKSKGNSKHSLSIKTLKEMYKKGENYIKGGLSGYYSGILNILLNKSIMTKEENEESKNYVLIIDEINRGNISKIFGELITLIETNKRLGNNEALEITLPYSGDKFSVPKNLYILGTMNTADRSIALMDTALRRRFDFEEMMPNHTLESILTDIDGINLQEILRVINERIEYLYDRDHMIGHAYFIGIETKDQLDNVMRNKIIPLLQEYFYDDWEKIQIVLGDHKEQNKNLEDNDRFIIAHKMNEIDILGFDHDDIEDESISYKINSKFAEKSYIKIYDNMVDKSLESQENG